MFVFGVILTRIFPHWHWLRRDTPYLSVFFLRSGHHKLYITHDTQDVRQGSECASDTISVMYRIWIRTEQNVLLPHFIPLFCSMSMLFSIVQDYKQYRVVINSLYATGFFLYPLKTENQKFSNIFRGYRKKTA